MHSFRGQMPMPGSSALPAVALMFASLGSAALPDPPRQHAPWQAVPALGIPQYVPELVPMLFDAGLADPRGGEYREIDLRIRRGESRTVTTHGWYFPQGFAVCWDGLAHPVVRVGGNADLWQDVAGARVAFYREAAIAAPPDAELVGVALLLRLGEPELARRLFVKLSDALLRQFPSFEHDRQLSQSEWFTTAGVSWLSGAFHEAVEAHASGDDRTAVDISELLLRARQSFESAWKGLSPELPQDAPSPAAFLDPVARLLADSERRLNASPRRPFDPNAIRSMNASARITALIERLEDVDERQSSQPGGVPLLDSPICKMLAQEGAEAIEPLLDALEHDQRLTRSYGFAPRSFFPPRSLITVANAAEAVLREYYHLSVFRWTDPAQRRAWLVRNKNRSQAERYFDLLSGDSNDEIQWLDAAQGLSGILGEELRGRRDPSVSELLAKRATQMATNWAEQIALSLYQWDPQASLPALQKVTRPSSPGELHGHIVAARLQLGDLAAAREWSAIIQGDRVAPLEQLAPLWTKPDDETLQEVARKLFIGSNASMSPSNLLTSGRSANNLLRSPLLIQPVFREAVLTALTGTEVIGTAERLADGTLNLTSPNISMQCMPGGCGTGFSGRYPAGKRDIRVGDSVAWSLSRIEGFPNFEVEAPPDEKDSMIARIADFLRLHSPDLRAPSITASAYPDSLVSMVRK